MHHKQEIQDIKSNAWMAVMGDGLHNFSDGLAIGLSFVFFSVVSLFIFLL
jgi:zinc transporter ZupT